MFYIYSSVHGLHLLILSLTHHIVIAELSRYSPPTQAHHEKLNLAFQYFPLKFDGMEMEGSFFPLEYRPMLIYINIYVIVI